jgi:hypothetical protein
MIHTEFEDMFMPRIYTKFNIFSSNDPLLTPILWLLSWKTNRSYTFSSLQYTSFLYVVTQLTWLYNIPDFHEGEVPYSSLLGYDTV